jgi:hypothetical protein
MNELEKILERMDPAQAAVSVALAARSLFALLNEQERREFIEHMIGDPGEDKVVGMVHL